mmetsp:Transcript_6852/g.15887  ORF Transcript_6852/g.15887 Transcript_6852/m.15887 type:complete len:215 (+) Transcript_6852:2516-3160(+)
MHLPIVSASSLRFQMCPTVLTCVGARLRRGVIRLISSGPWQAACLCCAPSTFIGQQWTALKQAGVNARPAALTKKQSTLVLLAKTLAFVGHSWMVGHFRKSSMAIAGAAMVSTGTHRRVYPAIEGRLANGRTFSHKAWRHRRWCPDFGRMARALCIGVSARIRAPTPTVPVLSAGWGKLAAFVRRALLEVVMVNASRCSPAASKIPQMRMSRFS